MRHISTEQVWRCVLSACLWLSMDTSRLHAQYVAPPAVGVAAGVAASSASDAQAEAMRPKPLIGRDLDVFSDPYLSGSSRLASACGTATEVLLSTTPLFNYANVAIANVSDGPLSVALQSARARFSDGRVRRLDRLTPNDLHVESGWWVQFPLRFPDKGDFKNQRSVDIDLVVLDASGTPCTVTTHFERDLARPYDARVHTSYWAFEVEVMAGLRAFTTGGLHQLGADYAPLVGVGIGYYPSLHHGVRLDLGGGTFGKDGVDRVVSERKFDGRPRVLPVEAFATYSARLAVTRRVQATYNPGVGFFGVELTDESQEPIRSTSVLGVRHQLRVAATLTNLDPSSDLALGLSLTHLWVPYGQLGKVDIAGHSFGVMLHFVVGGGLRR